MEFEYKEYLKLKENEKLKPEFEQLLIPGEDILEVFSGSNGDVCFTTGRLIIKDSTGKRGRRSDFKTILYTNLTTFSIDTSGRFDKDAGLTVEANNVGSFHFDFKTKPDVIRLYQHITYTTMK